MRDNVPSERPEGTLSAITRPLSQAPGEGSRAVPARVVHGLLLGTVLHIGPAPAVLGALLLPSPPQGKLDAGGGGAWLPVDWPA